MDYPYYPIQDYGPAMKGLVIGALGIFHVFTAQLAIGGGGLLVFFEWLRQRGALKSAGKFIDGFFVTLVLITFVLGAVTGVAMWFTSIQVSPRTIGVMVDEFHWLWATEWTFFVVEIVAGYMFYRYSRILSDSARMTLLASYTVAGWMSLFWINGILSFQLTPGGWVENGALWAGFFNASFWPSLIYRTLASMAIASLVAMVVINTRVEVEREEREELIHYAGYFLAPMALMIPVGLWYLASMPEDSRAWVTGGSPIMTGFLTLAAVSSGIIGVYAAGALWLNRMYVNGFTAALLCVIAFAATAGGEFVREGVRKPFSIREHLYSNSITTDEVAKLREIGSVTKDPYPLRDESAYPNRQLVVGAKVFRFQCSVCHTLSGANNLVELTSSWSDEQMRLNIAQLQRTKPFMPPFAGTPEELESLVQFLKWQHAARPETWTEVNDPETLKQIREWIQEADALSVAASTP